MPCCHGWPGANDAPGTAPTLEPGFIRNEPPVDGYWFVDACLGSANQDWYRITASQLMFEVDPAFQGTAGMRLEAILPGTGICRGREGCGQELLPLVPENTVNVDVYRASTMELVTTRRDEGGVVLIEAISEAFADDLLVNVSGPPEALYSYRLTVYIHTGGSEDECEC